MTIDEYRSAFRSVAEAHIVTLMREAQESRFRDLEGTIDRLYAWRDRLVRRVVEGDLA